MLINLHVKNLALIEEIDVNFKNGFNVLTGETGAGKSIIIGSINIALGAKVNTDIIRNGADYALVELEFLIEDKDKLEVLKEMGITDLEEGQLFITRKLMDGRTVTKINGENITNTQLKKITALLIDIHGQHEHQSLLNEAKHIEILDKYAKDDILSLKQEIKMVYQEYTKLLSELNDMSLDEKDMAKEISFLKFEINEIEEAALLKDEDVELEAEYKLLSNSKRIVSGVASAQQSIADYRGSSAIEAVGNAIKSINSVIEFDERLQNILSQLNDAEAILNDAGNDIADYLSKMDLDEEHFAIIKDRINLINGLKAKYGQSIEEILLYKQKCEEKYEKLNNYDELKQALNQKKLEFENRLEDLCSKLSKQRKEVALVLSKSIKEALVELNFLSVEFDLEFEKNDKYTANGYDIVRFVISTNPGEAKKPLSKIASGGEISRIMLAIKSVIADKDETDTLIFDEIDTGISGRTAQMVSEKINLIAKKHQVICITHLPQIAAMADEHFLIEKQVLDNKTVTDIYALKNENIVNELARLIGGAKITDATLASAKEMKELAEQTKNN